MEKIRIGIGAVLKCIQIIGTAKISSRALRLENTKQINFNRNFNVNNK